ncbi:HPP family-domain-containing protein [Syncephalastrum racemosum]|uniref:HPP family-domain-containing protein n=1 Tax=Syncephalastrum racemosum TaxID=13706 RepID=A0A1X2H829_SYNRA|nr:HPP family-domain-containing protein [Syncephalastrum racemosum]
MDTDKSKSPWLSRLRERRRLQRQKGSQPAIPQWRLVLWSVLAAFLGLSLIQIVFVYSSHFHDGLNVPIIIASFGATAVLIYGSIEVPLAQPRNVLGGHILSAVLGVCISKLFLSIATFSSEKQYETVQWVAGATSMSLALGLMQLTGTVHPPGGATALIPCVQEDAIRLGWYYIPIIILSAVLMLVVALLINNIERSYPVYWWSPIRPKESPTETVNPSIVSPTTASSSQNTIIDMRPT